MCLKRFTIEFTSPHPLKNEAVGSARLIKKAEGESCPLYDPDLPGCIVHPVKPQVCSAAF